MSAYQVTYVAVTFDVDRGCFQLYIRHTFACDRVHLESFLICPYIHKANVSRYSNVRLAQTCMPLELLRQV